MSEESLLFHIRIKNGVFNSYDVHSGSELTRLNNRIAQLEADVERIGRERDDMARAAQELQERLSAMEAAHVPDV
jgi:hypothetical protein